MKRLNKEAIFAAIASGAIVIAGAAFATAGAQTTPQPALRARTYPKIASPAMTYAYSYGESSGAYLGVDIQDITSDRVSVLKLKEERGVEITLVDQDAPAGKAGLKEHDVILDFNGTGVESGEQLRRLIHETPAGRTVTVGISRDGQPQQIKVTLADRRKDAKRWVTSMKTPMPPMPPIHVEVPEIEMPAMDIVVRSYSPSTGLLIDNLTPQLGEFFGIKGGEGVLVRSVEKGSAAEGAGLKAGDV